MIPKAQYMEINMSGANANLSPKIRGCKIWPHISTTTRPIRYILSLHPITKPFFTVSPELPSDPNSSAFFFELVLGVLAVSAPALNCAEKPNHIKMECRSSNKTLIGYSCASNSSGKIE